MFCPKCARPVAGEVQFCQQCGTALGGVRGLLEAGEGGDQSGAVEKQVRGKSPRRKGYGQGFVLVLAALLVLLFYPLIEVLLESLIPSVENTRLDELPLELFGAALLVLFAAGLARMLYARLFESAEASREESAGEKGARLSGQTEARALPPSQGIPVEEFYAGRVNTADFAKPASVTEHTTRSLRID
jgi:hypothetical protein